MHWEIGIARARLWDIEIARARLSKQVESIFSIYQMSTTCELIGFWTRLHFLEDHPWTEHQLGWMNLYFSYLQLFHWLTNSAKKTTQKIPICTKSGGALAPNAPWFRGPCRRCHRIRCLLFLQGVKLYVRSFSFTYLFKTYIYILYNFR